MGSRLPLSLSALPPLALYLSLKIDKNRLKKNFFNLDLMATQEQRRGRGAKPEEGTACAKPHKRQEPGRLGATVGQGGGLEGD